MCVYVYRKNTQVRANKYASLALVEQHLKNSKTKIEEEDREMFLLVFSVQYSAATLLDLQTSSCKAPLLKHI